MYKVLVTDNAKRDFLDAVMYIKDELKNQSAAIALLDLIDKTADSLSEMPGRYGLVSDEFLAKYGIRYVPVKNYMLFYMIKDEKTVIVVRFVYSKRNWEAILKNDHSQDIVQ